MGIKTIGRLESVTIPGQEQPTFITIYDFPEDDGTPRLRFGLGNFGPGFDLSESETRRMCSIVADWLKEDR
jgi:hypothetical protein